MKIRFFTKGENVKLFILLINEKEKELYEYVLVDGELEETSDLMRIMIDGFQGIQEINEEKAMELYGDKGLSRAMKNIGKNNG